MQELKAFLRFHILMGINHLPFLEDYWRQDPLLHYAPITDRITPDRFFELSRYLHFANSDYGAVLASVFIFYAGQ